MRSQNAHNEEYARFKSWWEGHGQFRNSRGVGCEKDFAYHAWMEATRPRPPSFLAVLSNMLAGFGLGTAALYLIVKFNWIAP